MGEGQQQMGQAGMPHPSTLLVPSWLQEPHSHGQEMKETSENIGKDI